MASTSRKSFRDRLMAVLGVRRSLKVAGSSLEYVPFEQEVDERGQPTTNISASPNISTGSLPTTSTDASKNDLSHKHSNLTSFAQLHRPSSVHSLQRTTPETTKRPSKVFPYTNIPESELNHNLQSQNATIKSQKIGIRFKTRNNIKPFLFPSFKSQEGYSQKTLNSDEVNNNPDERNQNSDERNTNMLNSDERNTNMLNSDEKNPNMKNSDERNPNMLNSDERNPNMLNSDERTQITLNSEQLNPNMSNYDERNNITFNYDAISQNIEPVDKSVLTIPNNTVKAKTPNKFGMMAKEVKKVQSREQIKHEQFQELFGENVIVHLKTSTAATEEQTARIDREMSSSQFTYFSSHVNMEQERPRVKIFDNGNILQINGNFNKVVIQLKSASNLLKDLADTRVRIVGNNLNADKELCSLGEPEPFRIDGGKACPSNLGDTIVQIQQSVSPKKVESICTLGLDRQSFVNHSSQSDLSSSQVVLNDLEPGGIGSRTEMACSESCEIEGKSRDLGLSSLPITVSYSVDKAGGMPSLSRTVYGCVDETGGISPMPSTVAGSVDEAEGMSSVPRTVSVSVDEAGSLSSWSVIVPASVDEAGIIAGGRLSGIKDETIRERLDGTLRYVDEPTFDTDNEDVVLRSTSVVADEDPKEVQITEDTNINEQNDDIGCNNFDKAECLHKVGPYSLEGSLCENVLACDAHKVRCFGVKDVDLDDDEVKGRILENEICRLDLNYLADDEISNDNVDEVSLFLEMDMETERLVQMCRGQGIYADSCVDIGRTAGEDLGGGHGWGKPDDVEDGGHGWGKPSDVEDGGHGWGKPSDVEDVDGCHGWGKPDDVEDGGHGWGKPSDVEDVDGCHGWGTSGYIEDVDGCHEWGKSDHIEDVDGCHEWGKSGDVEDVDGDHGWGKSGHIEDVDGGHGWGKSGDVEDVDGGHGWGKPGDVDDVDGGHGWGKPGDVEDVDGGHGWGKSGHIEDVDGCHEWGKSGDVEDGGHGWGKSGDVEDGGHGWGKSGDVEDVDGESVDLCRQENLQGSNGPANIEDPETVVDSGMLVVAKSSSSPVDACKLVQKINRETKKLNKLFSTYRSRTVKVGRLQNYLEQLKGEKEELTRLLLGVDRGMFDLRNEAAELRCTVTAVCDASVANIGRETDARRLEPACFRRYSNIRTPGDASNAMSSVRNRIEALNDLEVLIYRKLLTLSHALPSAHQDKGPHAKAYKPTRPRNSEHLSCSVAAKSNIVIMVESDPNNSADVIAAPDSPFTVSTPLTVDSEGAASEVD